MKIRFVVLATASTLCVAATAVPSLTLGNLKGPIARICNVNEAKSIAELWSQLAKCSLPAPAPSPTPTPTPAPVPTPTPTPTTSPTPSGYVLSPSLTGAPDLEANFDINTVLSPSWGDGSIPGLYTEDRSEGAFRFTCAPAQPPKSDDPLLFPGQPGRSHLHLWFGTAAFEAFMTPATMAANPVSTCDFGDKLLNRSAYWIPALQNDQGQVILPDYISEYYKRVTSRTAVCKGGTDVAKGCLPLPTGIRWIFGWDPTRPTAKVEGASWYCSGGTGGHYANLTEVFNSGCRAGDLLVADTVAPNCWNAKYLDTPDHRSHVAYTSYADGSGVAKCPPTHPWIIPQQESKATWTVTEDMYRVNPDGTVTARIFLASDKMNPGGEPGSTLHQDYFEGWVGKAKNLWLNGCIEQGLSCSGGDFGNGQQMKDFRAWGTKFPRIPIPPMTMMPGM